MTDSPDHAEVLDVFDDIGRHIGVKDRRAVHRDGDWHRVFHCLVVAERPETGPVIVLQLRSATKAAFPSKLDLTAAGHLAAGESPTDGIRELREELGIAVPAHALVPLGVRRLADDSGEGRLNKELTHVYLLRDDRPLTAYSPEPAEVDGVFDVPLAGALRLFGDGDAAVDATGILAVDGSWVETTRSVTRGDLVPNDGYWITLLVMAERFVHGHAPLAI